MTPLLDSLRGNRFVTEMLVACFLVMLPHKKREHFPLRAVVFCFAVELVSFFVMNAASAREIWQDHTHVVISSTVYVGVFALLSVCFISFCCPVSRQEAVYCVALTLCVQHFSSSFQLLLLALIPEEGYLFEIIIWVATIILPYCLFYDLCIRQICKNGTYQISVLNLTTATCLIFLTSALISIFAKGLNTDGSDPLFLISQVYEMLCCLFLLWMQVNQVNALRLQHELDIQNYLQHLRQEQFVQSRRDMTLLTHLMHELKHQVADMVTEEDSEIRDDLLEQIGENLQVYDETFNTKNEILNTVLMERNLYCRANHISWMVIADGEQLSFLNSGDLYLIFRNALDNAIESVVQLDDPQRRIIDVRVYAKNGFLMIQIENEFKGKRQFVHDLPRTTKDDRVYHGFGLKTIQQIAERYGGQIAVQVKKHRFTLQIMIPIPLR